MCIFLDLLDKFSERTDATGVRLTFVVFSEFTQRTTLANTSAQSTWALVFDKVNNLNADDEFADVLSTVP